MERHDTKTVRLAPWEEGCGRLSNVIKDDLCTTLDLGKIEVVLWTNEAEAIEDQLSEDLIGKRIAILRTDIPEKPVLLRVLPEQYNSSIASAHSAVEGGV